ncbi:MAG: helix-turn-helix transcriptional regulator [Phaeodactylibacter sp.]|nr:helix-turn-helix transcriptional regulator [Phaeodactylibacter sp.]
MLFQFNVFSSLLLIGVTQGIVYSLLLLVRGRQEGARADYWMAGLLLLLSLFVSQWMLGFAGWYDSHDWHTTLMFYLPFSPPFLLGPVFYCYFLSLTNARFQARKYWKHFIPAAFFLLQHAVIAVHDLLAWNVFQKKELPFFYNTRGPWAEYMDNLDTWWYNLLGQFSQLHLIAYLVATIYLYRRYKKYLVANFSNTEPLQFRWLNFIIIILGITFAVSLAGRVASMFVDLSYVQAWYYYFVTSAAIFVLSIQAYRQSTRSLLQLDFLPEASRQAAPSPVAGTEEPTASSPLDPELEQLRRRLDGLMAAERPYLDPDLNIRQLAERLNTNTAYLSRVINNGYGLNFNDFINGYRVRALVGKLGDGEHQHYTFLSLALDCGFNSKATFNRAFRKHTGKSPGEYVAGQ